MDQSLKVSTFQMNIEWEDGILNWKNILHYSKKLETDILVLPEMFLSGFSTEPERVAILESNPIFESLKDLSGALDAAICGSLVVEVAGSYYNRMYFVQPNGTVDYYDKRHLFRMAGEHKKYLAGNKKTIVDFRGFRFCLQVCYDLRFPMWSRNTNDPNTMYDCLIYVANWPKVRSDAWYCLLQARAIENWSYCIGVNRVGVDGNGLEYDGKSEVFDFKGAALSKHMDDLQSVETTIISKLDLEGYRAAFPAFLDADDFTKSVS